MPVQRSSAKGYQHARTLRQQLTPFEQRLWSRLRGGRLMGVRFRRQHALGEYIVDFCAIKEKLIIELDGSQHLEQAQYDDERTKNLLSKGYKVLRFWNSQITNDLDNVIRTIMDTLEEME